jgi:hypothetical protein
MDVRRVAGEEESSGTIVRRLTVVEAEVREPIRIAKLEGYRNRDVSDLLELVESENRAVARVDFCADLRRGDTNHSPGARTTKREKGRRATSPEEKVEGVWSDGSIHFHVAQYEGFRIRVSLERDFGGLPDEAMSTIASSDVGSANHLLPPIEMPQRTRHATCFWRERDHLHAALHILTDRRKVRVENCFRLGLRDKKYEWEFGVHGADIVEGDQNIPLRGRMESNACGGVPATHKSIRDPEVPENLEASGVHDEGA